jgi:hypothetical protein
LPAGVSKHQILNKCLKGKAITGLFLFIKVNFVTTLLIPSTYSKELKERLITYFKEVHDVDVSEEQAEEYLDSFASLFEAFVGLAKKEG